MKYYIADYDDPDFVASEQRYVDYIRAIWDRLPPELQRLCDRRAPFSPERVYLNDSTVQRVHADFREKTVEIVLLGESLAEDGTQTGSRLFTLKYGAVQNLTCDGDYDFNLPFGALHTDHVWDEIEILEAGLFEHRMLFAHHGWVEMSIVFQEVSISYADTLHSKAIERP